MINNTIMGDLDGLGSTAARADENEVLDSNEDNSNKDISDKGPPIEV